MNLEEINKLVGSGKRQQLIGALQYCMRSRKFYERLVIVDKIKKNSFKSLGSRIENMNLLKVECLADIIAIILITKNMFLLSTKAFLENAVENEQFEYITQSPRKWRGIGVNIQSLRDFYEEKNLQSILIFLRSIDEEIVTLNVKKLQTFQNESRELLGEELPEEFFTKGMVKQEKKEQTIFRIIILRELIRKLEDSTKLLENENFKNVNTSFLGIPKSSKDSEKIFLDFRKLLESIEDKNEINKKVEHILIDVCFPVIKDYELSHFVEQVEYISFSIKCFLEEAEKVGQKYSSIMHASRKVEEDLANLLKYIGENPNKSIRNNKKMLYDLEKKAKGISDEANRRYKFDEKFQF